MHVYRYDALGRLTEDKVGSFVTASGTTTFSDSLWTGLDGTVRRRGYSYESAGR